MDKNRVLKDIQNTIMGCETFLITSHYSPDGDNIGSCTGLYRILEKMNKKPIIVLDDHIPADFDFLLQGVDLKKSSEINTDAIGNYAFVALDCGDLDRLACEADMYDFAEIFINIDHHISNKGYGNINYLDHKKSSTCEMVYDIAVFLEENSDMEIFDQEVAMSLYTGLITDTGNFMYSNATPDSFKMASRLIDVGCHKDLIIEHIYQSYSHNRMRLLADVLSTLEIKENVGILTLQKEMLERNGVHYNDTDGIVDYARDLKNVEVGILLKEKEEELIKVSFRSKSDLYDVNMIASSFNGGGHKRAAGCTIKATLEEASKMIEEAIEKYKEKYI